MVAGEQWLWFGGGCVTVYCLVMSADLVSPVYVQHNLEISFT
jgi:hypothetical protein